MLLIIVKNAEGAICAQVPYAGGALTIGRDKARHIVLDSKAVSRHHGSLLSSGGKVLYVDEGSGNGSRVDGQLVTAPVPLTAKSVINIADYSITLQTTAENKPAEPAPAPAPVTVKPVASPSDAATATPEPFPKAAEAAVAAPSKPADPVVPPAPAEKEDEFDVQPVMVSPPPRKPSPQPTGLEGFRITLDDAPKAKPKVEAVPLVANIGSLLDQQLQGIRSQRQDYQETTRTRREQFDQTWRDAVVAARELKSRVGNDSRVLFYVISRDEQDVTVKLKENSSRGFCNVTISRRHPIKETMAEGIVWFSETGDEPRSYSDPKIMIEDFVRAIAAKLA